MPTTPNSKVKDILNGCEDLLNDFALPEEHTDRFVSIDSSKEAGNSITSSPTNSPGQNSSELARSKKAWGRAIDQYVASVLEDNRTNEDGGGSGGGGLSTGLGSPGAMSHRSHPDNHLLDALQNDNSSVSSHRSVDIDGHIDDSSFAPINSFGAGRDATTSEKNSRKEQIKKYLKEEWKPISLIALVILVAIVLSASIGGSSGGEKKPENPGFAIETPNDVITGSTPTPSPTVVPSPVPIEPDDLPTASPTYVPTTFLPTANPVLVTEAPTVPPSKVPTESPTLVDTPEPTPGPTTLSVSIYSLFLAGLDVM